MSDLPPLDLTHYVRDIPDFPKPGVVFRDITPLLRAPEAFGLCIDRLTDHFRERRIDVIVAVEARGFIFAAPLALALQASFVPVRKPGKLPGRTVSNEYELEYGTDTLHMHADAVHPGQRTLVVDDVLATGGTMHACYQLLEKSGAHIVGCAVVIELLALQGARRVAGRELFSLIQYA